jgi:hypothetical protein
MLPKFPNKISSWARLQFVDVVLKTKAMPARSKNAPGSPLSSPAAKEMLGMMTKVFGGVLRECAPAPQCVVPFASGSAD